MNYIPLQRAEEEEGLWGTVRRKITMTRLHFSVGSALKKVNLNYSSCSPCSAYCTALGDSDTISWVMHINFNILYYKIQWIRKFSTGSISLPYLITLVGPFHSSLHTEGLILPLHSLNYNITAGISLILHTCNRFIRITVITN